MSSGRVGQYSHYFGFGQDIPIIQRQKKRLADGERGRARDIFYR